MDVTSVLDAPTAAGEVFAVVADLTGYPDWLTIVTRAVPADPAPEDPGPAWSVDLRGRLGPLARSKRLRMVRTVHDAPCRLRFERREVDGRHHSPWVLDAQVVSVDEPAADAAREPPAATRLTMRLRYGGSFGGSLLERLLAQEIEQSRPRLLAVLARPRP